MNDNDLLKLFEHLLHGSRSGDKSAQQNLARLFIQYSESIKRLAYSAYSDTIHILRLKNIDKLSINKTTFIPDLKSLEHALDNLNNMPDKTCVLPATGLFHRFIIAKFDNKYNVLSPSGKYLLMFENQIDIARIVQWLLDCSMEL